MRAYTNGSYTMQNQSFRVQVWASHENDAKAAELAQELRDRVREAVMGSGAAKAAGGKLKATHDGQGQPSFHFTIPVPQPVKPVDDSETLVVEFDNAQMLCVPGFEKKSCRIDRGANGIHAVSYDGMQELLGARRWHTTTYTVGRHGVVAIRIERGLRRG